MRDLQIYEKAIEISQVLGDKTSEGLLIGLIGNDHYLSKNYGTAASVSDSEQNTEDKSIRMYTSSLNIFRQTGNKQLICTTLFNLGLSYASLPIGNITANLEKALTYYEEALQISRAIDNYHAGLILGNIGNIYANDLSSNPYKNIEKGLIYYLEALDEFVKIHDEENEILWLIKTAQAYINLPAENAYENINSAIEHLLKAREKLFPEIKIIQDEEEKLKVIWKSMHNFEKMEFDPVKNEMMRCFSEAYSLLENEYLEKIYIYMIPVDIVMASDGGKSLDEYYASHRYHWLSRMQSSPIKTNDILTIITQFKATLFKESFLKLSLFHPVQLSKRYDSLLIVHLYVPGERFEVLEKINELIKEYKKTQFTEVIQDTSLTSDMSVTVMLFSPEIQFSDKVSKILTNKSNQFSFIARPLDTCHADKPHLIKLTIMDQASNLELDSSIFQVKITDFVFDHISRPLLSKVISTISAISSILLFILTLIGKIDTAFGVTSGTLTGLIATYIYSNFIHLYKRSSESLHSESK